MVEIRCVAVVGAGTMGHGIAQVCAQAGIAARLVDVDPGRVKVALDKVRATLDQGVAKGKVSEEVRATALASLAPAASIEEAAGAADLVVEAVPEDLSLKQDLFRRLAAAAQPHAILATNTSSLSVARIASVVRDPARVLGTHFFNPVHAMRLLEIVRHASTSDDVLVTVRAWGARIGKECIVVNDSPGFATSRLGVALGMEAIRMLEAGVASAEDIDKAMVLGYNHPVGPLRLTDIVGLDVRMAIGTYLARELVNAAFDPPELMRRMVGEGRLGKKAGRGFYEW
jgi:3-hydroxybutyryl-CoA dehydrogenase